MEGRADFEYSAKVKMRNLKYLNNIWDFQADMYI